MSSILAIGRPVGIHIHVRIFAGPDEQHRALTGTLTMRPPEWQETKSMLVERGHEARDEARDSRDRAAIGDRR